MNLHRQSPGRTSFSSPNVLPERGRITITYRIRKEKENSIITEGWEAGQSSFYSELMEYAEGKAVELKD